jgi:hypothetical protein
VRILLIVIALLFGIVLFGIWRQNRRSQLHRRLLDLADEMEGLLNKTAARMQAMQGVVGRMNADFSEQARDSLKSPPEVMQAKKDLLQHRLWIQQNAGQASAKELQSACDALERAKQKIAAQLEQLEQAGAELKEATDAAEEAARREPSSLRRPPE